MNQIRIITKKIENVLCVVLLIILIFAVYAKVKITFNKDIHTNFFGYRVFEVASGSMEPTLSINDLLIVKVSDEELKKDDIIAYMRDDSIITHRIIMVDENSLIVKGDANNTIDSPINKDQVIGKVVKVLPQFGVWHKIFSEPKILVLMFITLLLFDFALSYGIKNEETKKDENVSSKDKTKKTTTKQKEVVEEKVEDKVEDKEEEIVIKEIKNEEKKKKEQKEKLLEFTRKIDLSQLDNIIDDKTVDGVKEVYKPINDNKKKEEKEGKKEKSKEEDLSETKEYTIRLDLNELQKNIHKKVK